MINLSTKIFLNYIVYSYVYMCADVYTKKVNVINNI